MHNTIMYICVCLLSCLRESRTLASSILLESKDTMGYLYDKSCSLGMVKLHDDLIMFDCHTNTSDPEAIPFTQS
jgi:hypothetical protein